MDKFLEKVLDKSIFKSEFSVKIPVDDTCPVCKGNRKIRVAKEYEIACPKCRGRGFFPSSETRVIEKARIQYTVITFDEKKEKALSVSITYREDGKDKNISVGPEDIIFED